MENHFKKSAAYRALEQQIALEMASADIARISRALFARRLDALVSN